MSENGRIKTIT